MATASKFWGGAQSSSSSDESSSDSEASSVSVEKTETKPTAVPSRWAAMEDSSSDEEERRVVRSAKEKQWDHLRMTIKAMHNHKNIDDFGELQSGLETLMRGIHKARMTVEKEGVPPFFVRALADLETYVNDKFADKESLKKLTKAKSTSFNILRSKVRKNLEEYRGLIEAYRLNPGAFADDEDKEDASSSDMSSSDDSSDEDDTSSSSEEESEEEDESEDESVKKPKKAARSSDASDASSESSETSSEEDESSDEWGSSSEESSEEEEEEEEEGRQRPVGGEQMTERGLKLWGKKTVEEKPKAKAAAKKKAAAKLRAKAPALTPAAAEGAAPLTRVKAIVPVFAPGEKIDAKLITKKLRDVTALRGRKGFDRGEQIRQLHEIATAAASVGPQPHLEALSNLIGAYFDANLGAFTATPPQQWMQVYEQINLALAILRKHRDGYFPLLSNEDEGYGRGGNVSETEQEASAASAVPNTSMASSLMRLQEGGNPGPMSEKLRLNTAVVLTSYLERLDDELTKALQLADVHSDEYKTRLGQTIDLLALLWNAYLYFTNTDQPECARAISLRILEHVYCKNNDIALRMWDMVKKRLEPEDTEILSKPGFVASDIVKRLVRENLVEGTDIKTRVRVILYQAYNASLQGLFHEARDLLQTANVQEVASQCGVPIQVLYNRNLVQLGLAAFSLGLTTEAHTYLSEVCNMGRYKELLAQGLSSVPRGVEKSVEQERLEKRRLLPYHMHIAADLVESVHNICAMLLEVPYMAANPFDYAKKPISRNFRRLLESYDRQIFVGPPESPRETVMAATKALQQGDWKRCCTFLMSLKIWDAFRNPEKVREMITNRVQQEALRTYLFRYSVWYDSFNVHRLAEMFSLPVTVTHSIVSKMMIQGSLSGSWDGAAECVLINRVERTPLQVLALQLTEKLASSVDQAELLLAYKNPKFILAQAASQRDDRVRRYDDTRWTDRRRDDWPDQRGQRWENDAARQTRFARQHVVVGGDTRGRMRR